MTALGVEQSPSTSVGRRRQTGDITAMIHALAEFERAADQCIFTEMHVSTALFSDLVTVRGHVAEVDGEVAAMALWFLNFSTWTTSRTCMWRTSTCVRDFAAAAWPVH